MDDLGVFWESMGGPWGRQSEEDASNEALGSAVNETIKQPGYMKLHKVLQVDLH